jgi:hypothetical protein
VPVPNCNNFEVLLSIDDFPVSGPVWLANGALTYAVPPENSRDDSSFPIIFILFEEGGSFSLSGDAFGSGPAAIMAGTFTDGGVGRLNPGRGDQSFGADFVIDTVHSTVLAGLGLRSMTSGVGRLTANLYGPFDPFSEPAQVSMGLNARIDGPLIPEPGSLSLLMAGCIVILGRVALNRVRR